MPSEPRDNEPFNSRTAFITSVGMIVTLLSGTSVIFTFEQLVPCRCPLQKLMKDIHEVNDAIYFSSDIFKLL